MNKIFKIFLLYLFTISMCFAQNWQEHYDPESATPFTFGGYFKGLLILGVIYFIIKLFFPNSFDD
ncbi:MAG: hypothetical protein HN601_12170 [Candidatus Marinimicrobia bacterium]|jgi:hypothetical protein|nr:hypothetical protein [Candidatus Neomarinimicrobiota bacterium]